MSTPYHPFPATHWSLVHRAGRSRSDTQRDALATLLHRYTPALRSHLLLVRRLPPDRADDLLQSFITDKLLERQLLQHADQARGRFRNFLLTTLNNFIISHFRAEQKERSAPHENAQRSDLSVQDADANTPHAQVEAAWARALVRDVLHTMRQEFDRSERPDLWLVFEQRILVPLFDNRPPLNYKTLAQRLQLDSPTQAANLLTTAKRSYARLLRAAIAEYEPRPDQIEEELTHLHQILASAQAPEPPSAPSIP